MQNSENKKIIFQFSIIATDYVARSITMPLWLRPAVGGLMIGSIAVYFPEILGVGYEATDKALNNLLPIWMLFALPEVCSQLQK